MTEALILFCFLGGGGLAANFKKSKAITFRLCAWHTPLHPQTCCDDEYVCWHLACLVLSRSLLYLEPRFFDRRLRDVPVTGGEGLPNGHGTCVCVYVCTSYVCMDDTSRGDR